jgi:hypothetical protein
MNGTSRHQVIKRLQAGLPRGAPFDLATLSQFGVSPQLAAHYADGGWLVRLAHGVYAFPNDEFGVYGALKFLQQRVPGLHVGGKSALALQGVRHNLASREALVLWGDGRFALPAWFTSRFPARYVHARLFDWPDTALASKTLTTPPGLPEDLRVAASERAVLELLYEAGVKQSLEEARNIFDGLRSPRKDLLGATAVLLRQREGRAPVPHLGARDQPRGCRCPAGAVPGTHRQQHALDEPAR